MEMMNLSKKVNSVLELKYHIINFDEEFKLLLSSVTTGIGQNKNVEYETGYTLLKDDTFDEGILSVKLFSEYPRYLLEAFIQLNNELFDYDKVSHTCIENCDISFDTRLNGYDMRAIRMLSRHL